MDIRAGNRLGRYELLVPIAAGGMASVWAAEQHGSRGFTKVVAVKVLQADLVDDTNFEQMFLDEAELAARIRHPNVAEITDLGEEEGVLFLVMEWVDGESLQAILRELPHGQGMPLDLATRIAAQTCAGLHAAHELKDQNGASLRIVHRDVSPQNLLVTYDGDVKIVDFGIAKATSNLQQTTVGELKGKAPYMSPEQARGLPVDRRTDIFALGIVLYQLTTGRHPFRGDNDLVTLRAITASTPVAPPIDMSDDFPEALNDVIVKALCKDPMDRFSSMEEMGRAIDRAALSVPIGNEDLPRFLQRVVGHRGEKRRRAIKAAQAGKTGMSIPAPPPKEPPGPIMPNLPSGSVPPPPQAGRVPGKPPLPRGVPKAPPVPSGLATAASERAEPLLADPSAIPPAKPTMKGLGGPTSEPPPAADLFGELPASPAATPLPAASSAAASPASPATGGADALTPAPSAAFGAEEDLAALAQEGSSSNRSVIAGLAVLILLGVVVAVVISLAPEKDPLPPRTPTTSPQ